MISIIIPVYNEEKSLEHLMEPLFTAMQDCGEAEVIFVDDGSTDRSFAILSEMAAQHPEVKVVRLARNMGQTAALQAGIDSSSGDTLVFMDADMQNDPKDIPLLLAELSKGYDVVSGWRKLRQDDPIRRNLPSRLANALISRISGVHLHDYGCTLKAYKRRIIEGVRLYGEMHRFIPIYAVWQGAKVTEVPVSHHARQYGQSKYGLERIFKVLLDLCVVKFLDKYLAKPIYVFGGCGLIAFLFSFCIFLWALSLKLFAGISFIQTPLPLLSGIAILVGFMCILMGLLAEVLSRTYFEAQGRKPYLVSETCNLEAKKD